MINRAFPSHSGQFATSIGRGHVCTAPPFLPARLPRRGMGVTSGQTLVANSARSAIHARPARELGDCPCAGSREPACATRITRDAVCRRERLGAHLVVRGAFGYATSSWHRRFTTGHKANVA
jgi:hypothetical protein